MAFRKKSTKSDDARNPFVAALAKSQLYLDYQRAFTRGTGLPLAMQEPGRVHSVKYDKFPKSAFCVLIAKTNKACEACFSLQQKLERDAGLEPRTLKCFAGLCETAIPVRVGENLIAFLHTGQVMLHLPTRAGFNRVAATLLKWGAKVDLKSFEDAYFQTRVLRPAQYHSLIQLLRVFAGHLAACGDELSLRTQDREPPAVTKARAYMKTHFAEDLRRSHVARAVNSSATYFSKSFKQATGMSFTDYIGRVRIEQAKNLLQNPSLRVIDIAFEVGFQSVSQFNRTFKKITGRSPKRFRAK